MNNGNGKCGSDSFIGRVSGSDCYLISHASLVTKLGLSFLLMTEEGDGCCSGCGVNYSVETVLQSWVDRVY